MLQRLFAKFKEAVASILPISILVCLLCLFRIVKLTGTELTTFVICSVFLIIGISLFNVGIDLAIEPMGKEVGSTLIQTKKMKVVLFVCFVLGLLITIAEPDLSVLAQQLKDAIPSMMGLSGDMVLIIAIGLGVGIFTVIGVLKIITKKDLTQILLFFYMMLFALASLLIFSGNGDFVAISFDSGGVTTGPVTVPFIMALGAGLSFTVGGRDSKENSFGLIALSSIGPIIVVVLLGLTIHNLDSTVTNYNQTVSAGTDYVLNISASGIWEIVLEHAKSIAIALACIFGFFMIIDLIFIKLPMKSIKIMLMGLLYAFVGLVMFLSAASIGFLPIGFKIGQELASNPVALVIVGFIIGALTVLAEPAVRTLTHQVDDVTMGAISKKTLMIALSIGVGTSMLLSMIRIIFNFSILYYVIPGYLIIFGLSFFVPRIYTCIASDAGGVASGPLTSTFVLPLALGACTVCCPDQIFNNGYGIVAMVAMTPLITIQLLGFKSTAQKAIVHRKRMKDMSNTVDDNTIINF